jgi:hypothetical protein
LAGGPRQAELFRVFVRIFSHQPIFTSRLDCLDLAALVAVLDNFYVLAID